VQLTEVIVVTLTPGDSDVDVVVGAVVVDGSVVVLVVREVGGVDEVATEVVVVAVVVGDTVVDVVDEGGVTEVVDGVVVDGVVVDGVVVFGVVVLATVVVT